MSALRFCWFSLCLVGAKIALAWRQEVILNNEGKKKLWDGICDE